MGEGMLVISPCCSHCCWSSNACLTRTTAKPTKSTAATAAAGISGDGRKRACVRRFLARPHASSKQKPQPDYDFGINDNNNSNNSNDDEENNRAFSSPDDLSYLWKLAAGSVGGAAVIKYGSALFPEVTRSNILQALLMIGIPVLDDLSYLWKLAAGSVGGAAVIKYGSALFPEVTRSNILQALLMIGIPVLVSVLLLIKESSIKTPDQDAL